ncbi:MAG: HDOD domain-containing protein [Planctomycetota bacterium]|nr:HDOD domain-containing protein [Planctomycetota bacterium]
MKVRSQLTAIEVAQVRETLDRRLIGIGVASQPEVVLRLLELSSKVDAQVSDYAKVIRTDHAVSGRVLKLANSSYFAQRSPVTSLERASVVLGLERLKAVSLGFQLSRAATAGACGDLTRRVWSQSVMRACVAAELARVLAPGYVAEAFVIGLMADAGVPLMPRLIGKPYDPIAAEAMTPGRLFRVESETLAFTHVDVVGAMARAWKLPELLARPLELHHTRPPTPMRDDVPSRLHALAFVTGTLEIDPATARDPGAVESAAGIASHILGLPRDTVRAIVDRSAREYGATVGMFSQVASALGEGADLIECIHAGLVKAADTLVLGSLEREHRASEVVSIGGHSIQATREADGSSVLVLFDGAGSQLVAHRFPPGLATPLSVVDALGLERISPDEERRLHEYLRARAA